MSGWLAEVRTATSRERLASSEGLSGDVLERVRLRDGRTYVVKRLRDARLARMWDAGVFARMPPSIDHALVGVEREGAGSIAVMRDVSAEMSRAAQTLDARDTRRLLDAVRAVHETFQRESLGGLELEDVGAYVARFRPGDVAADHPLRDSMLRGWQRFDALAPDDVGEAVQAIHADPARIVDVLDAAPRTLLHGDLRPANVALGRERIVVLDWGSLSADAPSELEFAFVLGTWGHRVSPTLEELRCTVERSFGVPPDRFAVASFVALAQIGWSMALVASEAPDARTRLREARSLEWWFKQARSAFGHVLDR
jgi:hypothetical protein